MQWDFRIQQTALSTMLALTAPVITALSLQSFSPVSVLQSSAGLAPDALTSEDYVSWRGPELRDGTQRCDLTNCEPNQRPALRTCRRCSWSHIQRRREREREEKQGKLIYIFFSVYLQRSFSSYRSCASVMWAEGRRMNERRIEAGKKQHFIFKKTAGTQKVFTDRVVGIASGYLILTFDCYSKSK